jgi:hypothetical protein
MATEIPPARGEIGASARLQVLATEHWSLLATRSLTYTESLSRVTIFLAILSGALIAIALVAQADRFGPAFVSIAIPMLLVVLFAGITTIARLTALNRDDYRWVIGMNRIRRAYLDLLPELEPHFVTGAHDDLRGALLTLGIESVAAGGKVGSVFHLLQTLPGMLTVIVAAVGGAVGSLIALALGISAVGIVLSGAAAFVVVLALVGIWSNRSFGNLPPSLQPRFPSDQ